MALREYGATFLNDVAVGPDGIYITDTGISFDEQGNMTRPGENRVYRVRGLNVTIVLRGDSLMNPNGIAWDEANARFILAPFGGPDLMVWNPGTPQEIFSLEELIDEFSLERINKAGARFDILKAQWYNQHYLKQKSGEELANYLLTSLQKQNIPCSREKALKIVAVMRDRVTFPQDFWEHGRFFFSAPETYDEAVAAKRWNADAVKVLTAYKEALRNTEELTADKAKDTLEEVTAALGIGTGKILQAVRLAITGAGGGPPAQPRHRSRM